MRRVWVQRARVRGARRGGRCIPLHDGMRVRGASRRGWGVDVPRLSSMMGAADAVDAHTVRTSASARRLVRNEEYMAREYGSGGGVARCLQLLLNVRFKYTVGEDSLIKLT